MSFLSEDQIHEIRTKADIVEVISRYLPLTKKGKSYWCTCPFHDDHDPSMSVSQDKQIFKCFVCGTGGNVFTFVQKYEGISFVEAVYKVADTVGIQMDHPLALPVKKIDPHKATLYKVLKDAVEFTHYQLQTVQAKPVKEYLQKRGITDAIINEFELGYNPQEDQVYKFLSAKKHKDEDILGAGMTRLTPMGMKDVFANRMMIPIHDDAGNPVGFSARRILENDDAKYINTQETDIYTKGNLMFNYHRAKPFVKRANKVFVVEGAMDVLAFEKVGLHNAVATLGTACTKEQIQLLKRLSAPVIMCYDGDKAGRNATYKFGKLASSQHLSIEIIDNRYGLDPDEIIDMYGKEELLHISEKTLSWIEFLFVYLSEKYNLENYSQKKDLALEMSEEIKALKDDFEKDSYYIRLRQLTGFDMQMEDAKEASVKEKKQVYQKRTFLTYPKSGLLRAEWEILSQMLCGIAASNYFKEELGFLKDEVCNKLAMYMVDYYRTHKEISVAELLDVIQEEAVSSLLIDIASWDLALNHIQMEVLQDAVIKVKACLMDDKIAMLMENILLMQDPLAKAALADEKNKLIKDRNELIQKGGRVKDETN